MLVHHMARRLLRPILGSTAGRVNARIPPSLKVGREFWSVRRLVQESRDWPLETLQAWRLERLRSVVTHAAAHVPGYARLFREAGFDPRDLRAPEDVRRLPFTSKETFRDALADFTSTGPPAFGRMYVTTGGSTGIPFGFHQHNGLFDLDAAFVVEAWGLAGFRWGDRVGILRGSFVGTPEAPFRRYNESLYHGLELSTYYLTPESYPRYRDALRAFRPTALHVYPSAGQIFATLAAEAGDAGGFPEIRAIFTASEHLHSWQARSLRQVFPRARLFDSYSNSEKAVFTSYCEHADVHHAWPQYGILEVLDPATGREVAEGEVGEIVATSFWNLATPFLRYRTSDRARVGASPCRACGRPWKILSRIEGRVQELAVTGDGRFISMTALNMHNDLFDHVRQFQFVQREVGCLELRVAPKASFTAEHRQRIQREMESKLGREMRLEVVVVAEIPRTRAGKLRFLEQYLPIRYEGGSVDADSGEQL